MGGSSVSREAEMKYYPETEPEQVDIFSWPEGYWPNPEGIIIKPKTTTTMAAMETAAPTTTHNRPTNNSSYVD